MSRRVGLVVVVVGLSGFTLACGGGTGSSVIGPSGNPASSSVSTGSGGGATPVSGIVRVQCEQRNGRSKVSVDGNNLRPGTYQARILSAPNSAAAPAKASVGDEVEFDFDSNPNDVASGATSIPAAFIQNRRVQGDLLDASGAVVATATVTCSTQ
jgi:hypothetical protein